MADTNSTNYTYIYAAVVVFLVAGSLGFVAEFLRPIQEVNEAFDKKKSVLKSVGISDKGENAMEDEALELLFENGVEKLVINDQGELVEGVNAFDISVKKELKKDISERQMPLYVYTTKANDTYYIMPLSGLGLWGPIWGFIAVESDFNTIYGISFDHKTETPGLGAVIKDDPKFAAQFKGKKLLDEQGEFISIAVKKGAVKPDDEHTVSGVSGATVTSIGVNDMLSENVAFYLNYFAKLKANN